MLCEWLLMRERPRSLIVMKHGTSDYPVSAGVYLNTMRISKTSGETEFSVWGIIQSTPDSSTSYVETFSDTSPNLRLRLPSLFQCSKQIPQRMQNSPASLPRSHRPECEQQRSSPQEMPNGFQPHQAIFSVSQFLVIPNKYFSLYLIHFFIWLYGSEVSVLPGISSPLVST